MLAINWGKGYSRTSLYFPQSENLCRDKEEDIQGTLKQGGKREYVCCMGLQAKDTGKMD